MFNAEETFSFLGMMEQMDKGILVRQALYDNEGEICDFKIVYANKAMEKFTNAPVEKLYGMTVRNNYPPEHQNPILNVLVKVVTTGQSSDCEYYSFYINRYVKMFNIAPLKGYVLSICEFIADAAEHYQQTISQESRTMQIPNNADEVFWVRKGDRILYVNPAFERVFGLSCSQFYSNLYVILEVVDKKDFGRVNNVLKNDGLQVETNYNIEFKIKRPDGSQKWLWLKTFFIREITGDIVKKAATVIDITERKLLEEELYHQNREITTLYDLFKRAAERVDLAELLQKAQQIILENINVDGCGIFLYNSATDSLSLESSVGLSPKVIDLALKNRDKLIFTYESYRSKEGKILAIVDHPEPIIREVLT